MKSKTPPKEVREKSCGVILYRHENAKREYLLLHYPGGHWDYPKGHVEEGDESEIGTARRELKEETGISHVEFDMAFREPMYYDFRRGRQEKVMKTVVYFLAKSKESEVKLSFEHKNYIWLPFDKAMKRLTFENAKKLLKKAEAHLTPNEPKSQS